MTAPLTKTDRVSVASTDERLRLRRRRVRRRLGAIALLALTLAPVALHAQAGSPWESAVSVLATSFTGPIARGLALISIVVGGLAFAFGESGSKRMLAGIVFGVGMAIGSVSFMSWLFP